ncbi:MAG TPA: hemolysin family protein [Cyclobacteriaceae bacterium]
MILDFLITGLLVVLNGFFVAAEFAIVKVRSSQIALQEGTVSKRAAQLIINNLDGFLAATQLGITLASLALGWIGEDVVSQLVLSILHSLNIEIDEAMAHRIALPTAFALLTIMHIVFGELAPKSMAIRYPTQTALWVAVPLRIFYFVFRPFIRLLNGFANLVLRMFGIKPVGDHEIHSEEELKLIIAESEEGGAIESSERELIQNVFDFDNRVVKQIMVPRAKVSGISVTNTLEETVNLVFREGYSRYPVYDKSLDEIVGVVIAKDVMRHFVQQTGKTLAEVSNKAYYVTEYKPIDQLLREFQKKKIQIAIVISEYGDMVGMVTLEDILEELVGEIQDEHDHEALIVTRHGNNFQVISTSPIHDINKILDKPLPESEDYDTLAGLLLHEKPFDLKEGEELEIAGYDIKILKMKKNLPELVELRPRTVDLEGSD